MERSKIKILFLLAITIIGIVGAIFFPTQNSFQTLLAGLVFMTIFPFLAVKFALKEPTREFGLFFPRLSKNQLIRILLVFFFALGLFFLLFTLTPLGDWYYPSTLPLQGFSFFLFTIFITGLFSLLYASFFQGFLYFFLEKLTREWAILLQWFCFIAFLFLVGALDWDMTPYVFTALFAGGVTRITQSFPISFLFTWIFVILVDMLLLKFF